jgi:adenylate cyclase
VLVCGVLPAVLTVALVVFRPGFVGELDARTYDLLLRASPVRAPDPRIVVVDIDDRSLASIGQWPWRRDVIARLVTQLRAHGARIVAFDLLFAEPDRYAGGPASGPTAPDAALADALRAGGAVLGYALTFGEIEGGVRPCVLHPLAVPTVAAGNGPSENPLFRATGAICSLPALAEAAGASGFLNAVPDADGILRRVPLVIEYAGRAYPGLALAAVMAATGTRPTALRATHANAVSLLFGEDAVPLDGRANLLVRYRGGKRAFRYLSAADVLRGQHAEHAFRDAIVFVGTTALGTREVVTTPLDTRFAGVEVHATVADNLVRRDFLSRPAHALTLEIAMVLCLGIAITLVVARVGLLLGTAAGVLLLAGLWAAARWQLSARGEYLSPLVPTIAMMASLAAATLARITQERRRAETAAREKDTARQLMVQSLLSLTEVRDADTGRHSRRIQQFSRLVAEELSRRPEFRAYLTPERIELLASLAPLHDIGKVGIPDSLLNKPGELTPDEFVEMKKHPAYGLDVIANAQRDVGVLEDPILSMAKDIVYTHHEWWDGAGYPRGLKGKEIPIAGRVVAVVDVYDAMTARRLYRAPLPHDHAVDLIVAGKGTHFDPAVVDAFVAVAPTLRAAAQL